MKVRIRDRNEDGRGRGPADRRVALVSQAHPGELVTVRVDRMTRGTVQGRVARLLERDPRRRPHACAHEHRCTGCPLLAAPLDDEGAFKRERVASALRAAAPEAAELVRPPERASPPFGYRHLTKQAFARQRGRVILGSHVAGTLDVVDNRGCPVLVPALADVAASVADLADELRAPLAGPRARGLRHVVARQSRATGRQLWLIATTDPAAAAAVELCRRLLDLRTEVAGAHVLVHGGDGNALLEGELRLVGGDSELDEELLGVRHRIGPRSFFQVNPGAAELLVRRALELAGEGERCVEGYSGVGALTLPLAERFGEVAAVESSPEACALLEGTVRRLGVPSIELLRGRTEDVLAGLLARQHPETVVLDPPRKGLGPLVADAVAHSSACRIVLLSCAPEGLAADVGRLAGAGLAVRAVHLVDAFPRTAHVEAVTLLERSS